MNSKVFEAYEAAKQRTIQGDFIDRLHSSITTTILFIVLGIVILKQYEGAAILCWTPAQFNEDQILYVHDFCWINSTYYFYQNGKFQVDANKFKQIDKQDIHYYQYIIFILSGQIMLFYLPSVLWKVMASDSRSYINKMLELCEKNTFFKSQIEKQTDDSKSLMSKDFANELKKEYSTLKTNLQKRKNKTKFNQQQQLQQSNSDDIPLRPYK